MEAFCEDDHQLSYFPTGIHWGPALFGALASFSSRPGDTDSAWVDHSGSRMLMPSACLFPFEFSMEFSVTSGTTGVIFYQYALDDDSERHCLSMHNVTQVTLI